MEISVRIKIAAGHRRKCRGNMEERIKRLENTVANIDPVKQVSEALNKEFRDTGDAAYEF